MYLMHKCWSERLPTNRILETGESLSTTSDRLDARAKLEKQGL